VLQLNDHDSAATRRAFENKASLGTGRYLGGGDAVGTDASYGRQLQCST